MFVSFDTMDALYRAVLTKLLDDPTHVSSPRGMKTHEDIGVVLELTNPYYNVLVHPKRKLNYSFMAAEFLWMIGGSNRVDLIAPFNKNITMAQDEGLDAFTGAYGPKIADQLPYVIDTLREDSDSRQALLTIWRERPRKTRDVPCTVSMQFFVRGGKLDMVTHMRSNDVWLGLPYDVFNFTMVQRVVAHALGVDPGRYRHVVGSLHMYERNFEQARRVLDDAAPYTPLFVQPFTAPPPLGRVAGLFADLATHSDTHIAPDVYIQEWWGRTKSVPQEWRDLLGVAAYRFAPGSVEPSYKWISVITHREA